TGDGQIWGVRTPRANAKPLLSRLHHALFGAMPVMANAWRSASKRAMTLPRVHAQLDDLERDAAADQFFLLGYIGRKRMISGVVHDAAEFLAKTSPKQQIKCGFEEGLVPVRKHLAPSLRPKSIAANV